MMAKTKKPDFCHTRLKNISYISTTPNSLSMNKIIPCIIVDDDSSAIDIIKEHLSEIPRLSLNKTFTRPAAALTEISLEEDSQLIFMDIDMPKITGISLAESLRGQDHNIIFTTSYPEYALEAFKVRARHYLLKPFDFVEFVTVVNEVIRECYSGWNLERENKDAFFLRTDSERSKLIKVLKSEIMYLQGSNNHVHIYTPTENFSVYLTIKEMEDKLKNNSRFFRIHKSYIVNIEFIKKIIGNKIDLGKYEVLMASHYKKDFIAYVERNLLRSKRN